MIFLHSPQTPFYDFLLSRGKNQWAAKVLALSGKCCQSYTNRQQKRQNNQFVLYGKITGTCSIDHLQSWDLCHSIHHELGHSSRYRFWPKYMPMLLSKKVIQAKTEFYVRFSLSRSHILSTPCCGLGEKFCKIKGCNDIL